MIEDILLVPYIDLGNFPNDLHLQHPDAARPRQEQRGNQGHLVRPGVINIPAPNIIRGRSTFVCFVPEFLHQIQYIPKESLDSPLH